VEEGGGGGGVLGGGGGGGGGSVGNPRVIYKFTPPPGHRLAVTEV